MPIPQLQSIRPQTKLLMAQQHRLACHTSGLQAHLFKYTATGISSLHDIQQSKAAPITLGLKRASISDSSSIADLYTTDRLLTLLCLVWLILAKLAQANCGKVFGKCANKRTCGSSRFTLMFHSPTIRGVLRIVLH